MVGMKKERTEVRSSYIMRLSDRNNKLFNFSIGSGQHNFEFHRLVAVFKNLIRQIDNHDFIHRIAQNSQRSGKANIFSEIIFAKIECIAIIIDYFHRSIGYIYITHEAIRFHTRTDRFLANIL